MHYRFFAFDVESTRWSRALPDLTPIQPRLICLVEFDATYRVIDRRHFFQLSDFFVYLDSCVRQRVVLFLFAHNLDFDFSFLQDRIGREYSVNPVIRGKMLRVRVGQNVRRTKNGREYVAIETRMDFRNSLALFTTTLKKLGEAVGLPKIENDLESIDAGRLTAEDLEYCYRDCEIIVRALAVWEHVCQELDAWDGLHKIRMTSASTAFKVFRNHHLVAEVDAAGRTRMRNAFQLRLEALNTQLREWYFGGRVEVYDFNEFLDCHYFDFNSLYGSVMATLTLPRPPYYWVDNDADAACAWLADVDETREAVPLLPERLDGLVVFTARKKRMLIFPEEREYLDSRDITYDIIRALVSPNEAVQPFPYMERLYNRRLEFNNNGQAGFGYALKVLINASYGRHAMHSEAANIRIVSSDNYTTEELLLLDLENVDGMLVLREQVALDPEVNVLLGEKIPALARLKETRTIHTLVDNEIPMAYSDTDSIVAKPNRFIEEGTGLGQLKREESFAVFQALNAKDYVFKSMNGEVAARLKGATLEAMEDYCDYHLNGIIQARPAKIREMLRMLARGDIESLDPVQRTYLKRNNAFYRKRIILDDLTTAPAVTLAQVNANERVYMQFLELAMERVRAW